MSDGTLVDDLLAARDALIQRGWHQGNYEGPDGSVCALGAINLVARGVACSFNVPNDLYEETAGRVRAMRDALESARPEGGPAGPIGVWNDYTGRTESEVFEVFDSAIRLAKDSL